MLDQLAARRFSGSPRVYGFDDQGREILSYIEGDVVWPNHFGLVQDDRALAEIAELIAELHTITATIATEADDQWREEARDHSGRAEVIGHNDLAPWNLIRTPEGWAFIDWDLAAPGRRLWDLGWAVHTLVPLWPDSSLDDAAVVRRLSVFADAYGIAPFEWPRLLDAALERVAREVLELRTRGAKGEPPWDRLVADGHLASWTNAEGHLMARIPVWNALLH